MNYLQALRDIRRFQFGTGDADDRVVPSNRGERSSTTDCRPRPDWNRDQRTWETDEILTRQIYADKERCREGGNRLGERPWPRISCPGRRRFVLAASGHFVVDAKVCGAREIARFWGLTGK